MFEVVSCGLLIALTPSIRAQSIGGVATATMSESVAVNVVFDGSVAALGLSIRIGVAYAGDMSGSNTSPISGPASRVTPRRCDNGNIESGRPNQGIEFPEVVGVIGVFGGELSIPLASRNG